MPIPPALPEPTSLSRRHLLAAAAGVLALQPPTARAAESLRVGFNAGVSFNESEEQQRRRYAGLLDAIGRMVGHRLDFGAVYSDRVGRAVRDGGFDLLLVHTHAALQAERDAGWRVLAFSEDRKDDAVHFFVRPDHPAQTLAALAGTEIGAPGMQSWATAAARAELRHAAPRQVPRFRVTRLQDVVPFMVQLRTVDAGVCRSKAVVDEAVASGRVRVVHVGARRPLYALIASPQLPGALCERLRQQSAVLAAGAFDGTPLRGLAYADADAERLRAFFLGGPPHADRPLPPGA